MHVVPSEIDSSSKVNTKAAATFKVVSDKPHTYRWRIEGYSIQRIQVFKRYTIFKGDRFSPID